MQIKGNKKQARNIAIFRELVSGEKNVRVGINHGMGGTRAVQIAYDIVEELKGFIDAKKIIYPRLGWSASTWAKEPTYWLDILDQYLAELERQKNEDVLTKESPVTGLGLSKMALKALDLMKITTIAQLLQALGFGDAYMLSQYRIGDRLLREMKSALTKHGFSLPSPSAVEASRRWLFSRMLAYLDHPEQFLKQDVQELREVIQEHNQ